MRCAAIVPRVGARVRLAAARPTFGFDAATRTSDGRGEDEAGFTTARFEAGLFAPTIRRFGFERFLTFTFLPEPGTIR